VRLPVQVVVVTPYSVSVTIVSGGECAEPPFPIGTLIGEGVRFHPTRGSIRQWIYAFGVSLSYADKYFFWACGFGNSLHRRLLYWRLTSPKSRCSAL